MKIRLSLVSLALALGLSALGCAFPKQHNQPTRAFVPATARTEAFLANDALPPQFTEEEFDQVLAGNFVTKAIYLPHPEFQKLALAGVETLVSTRPDRGVDPIVEGDRRGSI